MGSRLGVIVLSESGPALYYDHWAAQTIGMDVAIDGFEPTLARVRGMEPMGVDAPAEWKGAAWIEGSLLIDLTRRRIVWAEESEYLYLPRIVNHLIEHTWPGWTALWSPEGVRGILWLAGVDPATIFTEKQYSERNAEDLKWIAPWGDYGDDGAVSVRLDTKQLVAWRGDSSVDEVAEFGPDLIKTLAAEAQARSATGESVLWDSQPRDERPDSGIHVDFSDKTVRWWALGDRDIQIDAFDALWPGWSVQSIGDAYELHEATVGKPMRDWAEDVATVQDIVQRTIDEGPRENPMLRMASFMAERGQEITINAEALKFKAATDFGGARTALVALDALNETVRLPPARIVDRHGDIRGPASLLRRDASP